MWNATTSKYCQNSDIYIKTTCPFLFLFLDYRFDLRMFWNPPMSLPIECSGCLSGGWAIWEVLPKHTSHVPWWCTLCTQHPYATQGPGQLRVPFTQTKVSWRSLWHHSVMLHMSVPTDLFNSSLPGQNGCHFADNIFKYIFMNEKFCILIRISLKFVPKGLISNKSALVQVMAWCRTGDKPLPEPMLTQFTDVHMWH